MVRRYMEEHFRPSTANSTKEPDVIEHLSTVMTEGRSNNRPVASSREASKTIVQTRSTEDFFSFRVSS
jgi:hypothetical protein